MKKVVAIMIACCMLISVLTAAANAEIRGNNLETVADKLDSSVIECINNSTGYGTSFVIQYHGVTRDELFIQINRLTSMMILNVDFGAGKAVFGLPYSSIVRVAGLDCVDYITLFGKITPALQAKLNVMDDDDVIETWIEAYYIAYTDADIIAQTEEICGFKESEIKTHEQSNLFYSTRIHLINEADHNKVMEIFQKAGINYSDVVGGWDPDDVLDSWTGRYILTKAQILQASTLEEIALIDTYHKQDSPPDFYEPTSVPTEEPTKAPENTIPIEEVFFEKMKEDNPYSIYHNWEFQELYTHFDSNNAVDWVMIYAIDQNAGAEWNGFAVIGNRALIMETNYPFEFGMGLYDVADDCFYDLSKMTDYDKYLGLAEVIDNYGKGRLLGDLDEDDEITIVDVTLIQRCEAVLCEYPTNDIIDPNRIINPYFKPLTYYSDFNRDGDRDILDATCIQRYLADMPYSIGKIV